MFVVGVLNEVVDLERGSFRHPLGCSPVAFGQRTQELLGEWREIVGHHVRLVIRIRSPVKFLTALAALARTSSQASEPLLG